MLLTWTSQLNTSNDNFSFYFMTCFGFFSFPLGKIIWHVIHLGSKHHTWQMLSFIMYFWCTNSSDLKWIEPLMLFHQPLRNQFQPQKTSPTFETNFKKWELYFFPLCCVWQPTEKPSCYHPQSVFVISLIPTTIWNHMSSGKNKPTP